MEAPILIILGCGFGLIVLLAIAVIFLYNSLVRAKTRVDETLKQIDVRLQNRYDLLPDLIQAVEKATSTDENIQTKIAEVRSTSEAAKNTPLTTTNAKQRAEVDQSLSNALNGLKVSVEAYPELRSQEAIQNFMQQNENIEERIAAARQIYNSTVREYNEKIKVIPTNIIAGLTGFKEAEYFEAKEEASQDISPEWGGKMTTR
jgi:LemA protein